MPRGYSIYIYVTDDYGKSNKSDGYLSSEFINTEEITLSHKYKDRLLFKNYDEAIKTSMELLLNHLELKGIDITDEGYTLVSWRCIEDVYYCEIPMPGNIHHVAEISKERLEIILSEIKEYGKQVYIFNKSKRFCNILIGEKYYQITSETAIFLTNRRQIPILNHEDARKVLATALGHPEGIVDFEPSHYIRDGILSENIRDRRHFKVSWYNKYAVSYVDEPQFFVYEEDEFDIIKVAVNLSGERKPPSYVMEHKKEIMDAGIQKLKENRKFMNSGRNIGMYAITNMTLLSSWKVMITFEVKKKIKELIQ